MSVSTNTIERLVEALQSGDVEITIRKIGRVATVSSTATSNDLHTSIIDFLKAKGKATGREIREHIAASRKVDPQPIANEVAWGLVELQSSSLKRSSFIDGLGPVKKDGKHYTLA